MRKRTVSGNVRLYNTTKPMNPVRTDFPHRHLDEAINRSLMRSEIEGGVCLDLLPDGAELEVETENHCYRLRVCGRGHALISGHPRLCPEPVLVKIYGSSCGGSLLRRTFIGRGLHLEFRHPEYMTILTSPIVEIRAGASL